MKQSVKINYKVILVSIIVDVLLVVLTIIFYNSSIISILAPLMVSIVFASIFVIIFSIIAVIKKKRTNRALEQLPYNFNYQLEYEIYKRVDKKKKDRTAKEIEKMDIKLPNKYTVWKMGLLERNISLKNNEDFYHFLKRKLRRLKNNGESVAIILTPLEIGIMTVFLTSYIPKDESLWVAIPCASVLLVILMVELLKSKNEIAYVEDVIEVLCPDYSDLSCNRKR